MARKLELSLWVFYKSDRVGVKVTVTAQNGWDEDNAEEIFKLIHDAVEKTPDFGVRFEPLP